MPVYELAALGAAVCWAVTGLIGAPASVHLGPFAFGLYRQTLVALILAVIVWMSGLWQDVTTAQVMTLALSGIVGIFAGDTMLYFTLNRLGPRRAGALFALNAPMAAILGWILLDEDLSLAGWAGVFLCAAGVSIAVLGRPGRSGSHRFEAVHGNVVVGILFGLGSALGQALGSLIARPVMQEGFDPVVGTLIRVFFAVLCLGCVMALPVAQVKPHGRMTPRIFLMVAGSGIVAMVIGMSLMLFSLQGGKVGIVSTLSALSPVFILPVLWIVIGARPSAASWLGAAIAVAGMALIFLR
ncbi:DMT family transporter [Paracoccus aerodenitrificans]|uniref:DMT family transporter n=1 Tax=Paracoccus aerodenitrificans TaxID=3017781 RepID=UPI0022F06A88|nr:DMT family transporter [Paracoccus aerodenitrificans]WBU65277.1 DMT family transporter [Paracoccus aerodenitrificans]